MFFETQMLIECSLDSREDNWVDWSQLWMFPERVDGGSVYSTLSALDNELWLENLVRDESTFQKSFGAWSPWRARILTMCAVCYQSLNQNSTMYSSMQWDISTGKEKRFKHDTTCKWTPKVLKGLWIWFNWFNTMVMWKPPLQQSSPTTTLSAPPNPLQTDVAFICLELSQS